MKLAVFGDSWTWGDELIDPKQPDWECCYTQNDSYRLKHCFAGQIAQHYNCELENYGHPGASLQSIIWTFLWWLRQDIDHKDYVILIGLTAADRQSWYNPNHKSYSNDPVWNKYIHNVWVNFGSSIVPDEWGDMVKAWTVLSQCNELSEYNYESAVYLFDGVAHARQLRLAQYNIFQPPKVIDVTTMWWPNDNYRSTLLQHPMREDIHAKGDHPNENGHQIISKQLIKQIDSCILT